MILLSGFGDNLIVTQGYGRLRHTSFPRVKDFELSCYKFFKENFEDVYNYTTFYGSVKTVPDDISLWVYFNFSEINIAIGLPSFAYINVYSRVVDGAFPSNEESLAVDRIVKVLDTPDIDLYDFTVLDYPVLFKDNKILVFNDEGKQTIDKLHRNMKLDNTLYVSYILLSFELLKDLHVGRSV